MINLFCCFKRKLSEKELREISFKRIKILPIYYKLNK